jgi:nucleoside-diphosphate-sugar epimerase
VTDEARMRPSGSEVERLLCDNTRAREWCGWEPEHTLEEGLRITSDWVRDHLDLFNPTRYDR